MRAEDGKQEINLEWPKLSLNSCQGRISGSTKTRKYIESFFEDSSSKDSLLIKC